MSGNVPLRFFLRLAGLIRQGSCFSMLISCLFVACCEASFISFDRYGSVLSELTMRGIHCLTAVTIKAKYGLVVTKADLLVS